MPVPVVPGPIWCRVVPVREWLWGNGYGNLSSSLTSQPSHGTIRRENPQAWRKIKHRPTSLQKIYRRHMFHPSHTVNQNSQEFMDFMNSVYSITKFTEECSLTEVVFLDCQVKRRENGLYTDLYVKETATHSYVRAQSCHPKHTITIGPYSQILRKTAEIAIMTTISRNVPMVWKPTKNRVSSKFHSPNSSTFPTKFSRYSALLTVGSWLLYGCLLKNT